MIGSTTLRLVLLVSCAHALVHVYELSLPSIEQELAHQYHGDDAVAGKAMTGRLSTCWRLPWGFGALLAGWLIDHFGCRPMLAIYLLGCGLFCAVAALCQPLSLLFLAMIGMGTLASIYHPAGLTLISYETDAVNRPQALGIHGIFGSAGIAAAPLLAFGLLAFGMSWRGYYWVLVVPGVLLGLAFVALTWRHAQRSASAASPPPDDRQERTHWGSFVLIILAGLMQGLIYSAVMSFLPRYLSFATTTDGPSSSAVYGKVCAAGVLVIGCVGQYLSARWAKPRWLERQLTIIAAGNAPLLLWMALADGWWRPAAAGCFSLVHFMHQPIYNSLIAKYTPRSRRSVCYGLSFATAFGIGSLGAMMAGNLQSDAWIYGLLAWAALVAALLGAVLSIVHRRA